LIGVLSYVGINQLKTLLCYVNSLCKVSIKKLELFYVLLLLINDQLKTLFSAVNNESSDRLLYNKYSQTLNLYFYWMNSLMSIMFIPIVFYDILTQDFVFYNMSDINTAHENLFLSKAENRLSTAADVLLY